LWALSPNWRPTIRTWLSLLALGFALWLMVSHTLLIFEVLAVLFAAYLLSLTINPLADVFARWGVPREVTIVGFYVVAAGVLVLLARLLFPVIRMETGHLRRAGPVMLERALAVLRSTPVLQDIVPSGPALFQDLSQSVDVIVVPAFIAVRQTGGVLIDFIVVLALAFFFVADQGIGNSVIYGWIPAAQRARSHRISSAVRLRLTRWIWAQAAVAVYFAVTFSAALALLRVPFALTIGLVGGLLELIPYVGGLVAFALAVLSALSVDPVLVIWVTVIYVIIIQTESHVLGPLLYGRATGLHPASVLVALLVGAKAAGLAGVLFAVPVAVIVATLIDEAQRIRDEQVVEPAAVPGPTPASELENP
jgi:predicted PurR-regulated permease PerM